MGGAGRTGGTGDGRSRTGRVLSGLAVAVGSALFLGGFGWGAFLYRPYTVPTGSMAPTVGAGDRVLAQRVDGSEVRRGDVVVFTTEVWGDLPMVKRVIGVGGDTVACCDGEGRLTVNGEAVEEPYLSGEGPASPDRFEAAVPRGKLFLLGDDRDTSLDSREHLADGAQGSVDRGAVQARVEATAWPLDGFGMLPRPAPFESLPGGVSRPGPLPWIGAAAVGGAALILGGAAYDPLARRAARRRAAGGRERVGAG